MKNNIEQINSHFKYVTMCINALLHTIKNDDYENIIDICLEVAKNVLEFKQFHKNFIKKVEEQKNKYDLDFNLFNIFDSIYNTSVDDYQFQIYLEKICREFKAEFGDANMKADIENDFQTMGASCIQIYVQKFLSKVTNVRIKVNSHAEYLARTNKVDDDCIKKIITEQKNLVINYKKYISFTHQYIYLSQHKNEKNKLILNNVIKKQNTSKINCQKNINHITDMVYLLIKAKPYFIFDIFFVVGKQFSDNWMSFIMKFYNEGMTIMELYNSSL